MIKGTIVLEGGATRGIFTSGVLDYLMRKEVYFSNVIGVSAGCCNGVDYISRQIERSKKCILVEDRKDYYIHPLKTFSDEGLIDFDKMFYEFPFEKIPFDFKTFFASKMTFDVGLTDCRTGLPVFLRPKKGDVDYLMNICKASSSVPLFSNMVEVDGSLYLDGGCADSIPIRKALEIGNEKIIVVLTRKRGFRLKNNHLSHIALKRKYKEFPNLVDTLSNRAEYYNSTLDLIDELERENKIFVIAPSVHPISNVELIRKRIAEFYDCGFEEMRKQYLPLISYLNQES